MKSKTNVVSTEFPRRLKQIFPGQSVAEIARKLGVPHATVRNYFNGRLPAPDILIKLTNETDVSLTWLLTGAGPQWASTARDHERLQLLTEAEEVAVRELAAERGEGYEDTLRGMLRDRLRALGKLPAEAEPLRLDYYGSEWVGAEWVDVPLLGHVAAGSPIEVFEFKETARVIKTWPDSKKAYALRVTGDSMEDAGIQHGDLIVCLEASEARRGQLVVALIDGDKATVKRFYRENGTVILRPENPAHEPQRYEANRVRIQGRVESIIRAGKDTT